VESLTNRAAQLRKHCGVELIVHCSARVSDPAAASDRRSPTPPETFGRVGGSVGRPATAAAFDVDRAKVMTKASQWLKVLIVNTGLPIVVCGMPEAEYVLSAEDTARRFKQRLTLRCFTWRTPQRQTVPLDTEHRGRRSRWESLTTSGIQPVIESQSGDAAKVCRVMGHQRQVVHQGDGRDHQTTLGIAIRPAYWKK